MADGGRPERGRSRTLSGMAPGLARSSVSRPADVDLEVGPTRRLRYALVLAFATSFAVAAALGRDGTLQTFAAFGQVKRIALPAVFVLFLGALLWRGRDEPPTRISMPRVWAALLWIVGVSTLASVAVPTGSSSIETAAQGLVLFVGMGLSAALGWSATAWPAEEKDRLLTVLLVAAVVALIVGAGPFVSLAVPAVFTAAFLAVRSPRQRLRMCLLAVVLSALYWRDLAQRAEVGPISVAVELEIGVCAVVFLVAVLPRSARRPVLAVGGVAAVVAAMINVGQFGYVFGEFGAFDDVTLAQRGYETFTVAQLIGASPVTLLLGAGPGGVVNLALSPDAATLFVAGRDLTAVDDVHLLTSHLLLKLGVAGLVWLAVLVVHMCRIAWAVLREQRPEPFDVALLMFVVGGIAVGIPAANNFIANPLPVVFLGVLAARMASPQQRASGRGPRS